MCTQEYGHNRNQLIPLIQKDIFHIYLDRIAHTLDRFNEVRSCEKRYREIFSDGYIVLLVAHLRVKVFIACDG